MESFGPTFKLIRQEKGYALKEVADGIISIPSLSKFENGHSDIKLMNFTLLLNKLAISWDEFMHFHTDAQIINVNQIVTDFTISNTNQHDRLKLKKLGEKYRQNYEIYGVKGYELAAVACECYSSQEAVNKPENRTLVYNHLKQCESWGKFEIFIYNALSFLLSIEEIRSMSSFFLEQVKKYPLIIGVDFHETVINQALVFIRAKAYDDAESCLQQFYKIEPIYEVSNIQLFLLAEFVQGLLKIAKGDDTGEAQCIRYLDVLSIIPNYNVIRNEFFRWIEQTKTASN